AFEHIPGANARIAELTGVVFGADHERMLAEGRLMLDSDAAARGLAALRAVAGAVRGLEMAAAMQAAFYGRGRSLSDPRTY
ncbi:DsbA family protein, partial [Streptomyces brasiliscabiei]